MSLKVSRQGVQVSYGGDRLLVSWPWKMKSQGRYVSSIYGKAFASLREYWMYAGASTQLAVASLEDGKMGGFDLHEVFAQWTSRTYPDEYVLVLLGVDASKRDESFWQRIPKSQRVSWEKDVQLLRCKDRTELLNLSAGIEDGFAESYCFFNGQLVDTNRWV